MFDKYPTIFVTRYDCLRQLFLTNGNGYDWENGELVDYLEDSKEYENLTIEKAIQNNLLDTRFKLYKYYRQQEIVENKPLKKRIFNNTDEELEKHANGESNICVGSLGKQEIYHLLFEDNTWCALSEIPDDIKPDWKLGAEETVSYFKLKCIDWGLCSNERKE